MAEILVDIDKMTAGLEQGLGETRTEMADLPPDRRLRFTGCGIIATAIHLHAIENDIQSQLVVSEPMFPFDLDLRHVMPLLGPDPAVIDATPSQFLQYAGLTAAYEDTTGVNHFPPEKVLSFRLSDRRVAVDWLVDAVLGFQKVNRHPDSSLGLTLGHGPLSESPPDDLRVVFGQIWNPANMGPWDPPLHVQEWGSIVSRAIPAGAITMG